MWVQFDGIADAGRSTKDDAGGRASCTDLIGKGVGELIKNDFGIVNLAVIIFEKGVISIKFRFGNYENVIYKVQKKVWLIPFCMLFCPLWTLFGFIFFIPCFKNIFLGAISFNSLQEYIFSIVSLIVFLPLAILLPLSYTLNQLIITESKVIIRKGVSGKLISINVSDISIYQHMVFSSKGITNHYIRFYLKNGKYIKSGNLYITKESLSELLGILDRKIKNVVWSRSDIKKWKMSIKTECTIETKRIVILPIVSLLPFVLAFTMLVSYLLGVNSIGRQKDIQVSGVVYEKKLNYSKKHEVSGFEFNVKDMCNNITYNVSVNEIIYNKYSIHDKVLITAKKGFLGIVYDTWFYKN